MASLLLVSSSSSPVPNVELHGTGSARSEALVLCAAPASADGAGGSGERRVRTGQMDAERRQCEYRARSSSNELLP